MLASSLSIFRRAKRGVRRKFKVRNERDSGFSDTGAHRKNSRTGEQRKKIFLKIGKKIFIKYKGEYIKNITVRAYLSH